MLSLIAGCEGATGPDRLRGDFALVSLYGKQLPLPDGASLLIGDSLTFSDSRPEARLFATIVHRRTDGTVEVLTGYQTYQRRGDTVTTSFSCRFSDICLAWDIVAAPETGILRNDSLIFSPKSPNGPTRIYRRAH